MREGREERGRNRERRLIPFNKVFAKLSLFRVFSGSLGRALLAGGGQGIRTSVLHHLNLPLNSISLTF